MQLQRHWQRRGNSRQPRKIGKITSLSMWCCRFLRAQKEYTPPAEVKSQLEAIYSQVLGTTDGKTRISDFKTRFELFCACESKFQHKIPNSLLHTIETVEDVTAYYQTSVDTITPLENLRNLDLPKNLHVQYEYHRFHPDTDTKFGGVTAFPGSSTIVTGLKYKDKYKGHIQKVRLPNIM